MVQIIRQGIYLFAFGGISVSAVVLCAWGVLDPVGVEVLFHELASAGADAQFGEAIVVRAADRTRLGRFVNGIMNTAELLADSLCQHI